ncbi:RNA-binding transcriptional accessory protein [bacterium]|nr:RNA-binding transcriptional accessory protein [bacterium]
MHAHIAAELRISPAQVSRTAALLDDDNTVPFIARYRKEVTGSLDEEQIRAVQDRLKYLRTLEERKQSVLKSITEQGKLTPELEKAIREADKLQDVEDLYLPYKPKRRTRATVAREKGLEPLALLIMAAETMSGDPLAAAAAYIDPEKGVDTAEDALAGACDIVAETVAENAEIRKLIRTAFLETGVVASETADKEKAARDYEMYMDFREAVRTVPSYRILAINRGEKEEALYAWIDVNDDEMIAAVESALLTPDSKDIFTPWYRAAIADGYTRLIEPAIQREVRTLLRERAEQHAIDVFSKNLRALLMSPPLKGSVILGIDPGYRTGCKAAVIDSTGKYIEGTTIYPHAPQKQWDAAKRTLARLVGDHGVDIIAIGNGTAGRETEQLAAELIGELDRDLHYAIVNEAGASVYSASPVAKKEFPDLDVSMRGNISIARRLLDPLSELVKIDPKSIGVGLYQHDVDQNRLGESLDAVVESCVNQVGVDLNTASSSLLRYVAGINSRTADNIVSLREERGFLDSRMLLREVQGLGEKAFTQCAGFLRIPESDTLLDRTAVHPESYEAATRLVDFLELDMEQIKRDGSLLKQRIDRAGKPLDEIAGVCGCGRETLTDIISALEKPGRDPRSAMPAPVLRSDVLSMDDLYEGLVLKGTVRNVVDFGAFVDIGVKQDGLVHLSRMARKFVKNPLDIVSVGDIIDVKILSVDKERGRIALSMILD